MDHQRRDARVLGLSVLRLPSPVLSTGEHPFLIHSLQEKAGPEEGLFRAMKIFIKTRLYGLLFSHLLSSLPGEACGGKRSVSGVEA